jgi:hypothetical protein
MEFWSIGVLRYVRLAPRDCEVGDAEGAVESNSLCRTLNEIPAICRSPFQGGSLMSIFLGLKPQAEFLHPFGINRG